MSASANRRYSQVGLDRLVRLKWLERTAYLVLAGNETSAVKTILQQELAGAFRSDNTGIRGSLDKTITILLKIWANVPRERHSLHSEGADLFSQLPRNNRIVLHWGMTMAAYPFWGAVATHTGRLLRLQGTATSSEVQRRIREQYGERETVFRRVRYVLRSYVDWGVLKETQKKGVYGKGEPFLVSDPALIAWLVEASLCARSNKSATLKELLDSPGLFPFRLTHISAGQVASLSPRLDILRHSLDDELVILREEY